MKKKVWSIYCGNLLVDDPIERCLFNAVVDQQEHFESDLAYVLTAPKGGVITQVPTQKPNETRYIISGPKTLEEVIVSEYEVDY
ncbi:MAG: hypothetical protein K6U74_18325 [Firmicutes bacterium]|nr:hypothetical protein [Bacillota bacterium]